MTGIFKYGAAEISHLKAQDPCLGSLIECRGKIERQTNDDLFSSLVHSIVSQQISDKAAVTVWQRLQNEFGEITRESLAEASEDRLIRCGISARKARYIKDAATSSLDFDALKKLPDETFIRTLSALSGVGVWTCEMLLIFCLARPDVVSFGDFGIKNGMKRLYGLTTLDKQTFLKYRKNYTPFGSVASFYLWELSNNPSLLDEMQP
jgi:DNA-3-methyladenine glycosylase II